MPLSPTARRRWKTAGLALVFIWFMVGGICHFVLTDAFVSIMPPYIPYHTAAVYISGVFEIIGAIGILIPKWRSAAGYGLMLLTVLVTPANVHMWLNPQLYPSIPPSLLGWRLVVQVLLLVCIWWSTRPEPMTSYR